jgi:hypothetical protein
MGQISAKLIKRLGTSRKLTAELRRESGSIRDALDAMKKGKTARSRTGEALDPLHAVYAAVQNVSSVFAERVRVLPEFDPYYRVVLDAQETYMPGRRTRTQLGETNEDAARSAAHTAVGLAGESPVVGIDCLPT